MFVIHSPPTNRKMQHRLAMLLKQVPRASVLYQTHALTLCCFAGQTCEEDRTRSVHRDEHCDASLCVKATVRCAAHGERGRVEVGILHPLRTEFVFTRPEPRP